MRIDKLAIEFIEDHVGVLTQEKIAEHLSEIGYSLMNGKKVNQREVSRYAKNRGIKLGKGFVRNGEIKLCSGGLGGKL